MRVDTTRFGVLEIDEGSIIRMPKGPIGFEEQTDYCLIQHRPDSNFRWLQSVGEPGLAFVVVDPSEHLADCEIEVPDAEAARLRLKDPGDAMVLVIVTIGDHGREISANLAAPIVINSRELVGMQVILQDSPYPIEHPLVEQPKKAIARKAASDREETVILEAA